MDLSDSVWVGSKLKLTRNTQIALLVSFKMLQDQTQTWTRT